MKTGKLFFMFLFIALNSCYVGVPIKAEKPANNESYEVDYLFEHEGCKVYRFYDRGNYVYFTNCAGNVTSIGKDSTETRVVNYVRIELPGE
jgi:hypothetical protein